MSTKTKPCYCCICSNLGGKTFDGSPATMRRFPQDDKRRKMWIQRCRLVRRDFKFKSFGSTRLCGKHFVEGRGPQKYHNLPSIFPTKIFKTSYHGKEDKENQAEEQGSLTSHELPSMDLDYNYTNGSLTVDSGSHMESSLLMHSSYCDFVSELPPALNKDTQTPILGNASVDSCTQTDASVDTFSPRTDPLRTSTADSSTYCVLPTFCYEDIKASDEKVLFYTGIPDAFTFEALYNELKVNAEFKTQRLSSDMSTNTVTSAGRPRKLRLIDEFLLVLMRLRLGLLLQDLADRFRISTSTCGLIFNKWIDFLESESDFLIDWPSREQINEFMPISFKRKYPSCRVIIDCTEIYTETPRSLTLKSAMYSDYKSHMTFKSLVGISPAGVVTFVSDLYTGSTSDKQMTKNCGIVDLCEEGDSIMVDKGFLISDLTTPKGVHLIIPPFKTKAKRFSKREVEKTKTIANLRIHVERQMERIKNFRVLQGVMPISMASRASAIWKICTRLTNLQPPLVYNKHRMAIAAT